MYYIGIDLGGTNIKAAVVSEDGKIIRKDSVPTYNTRGYAEIVKDMAELGKRLIAEEGLELMEVHSIGVGSPGTPDPEKGILLYTNNIPNFVNVPLRKEIQKTLDLPVFLENDANCAALGETISGAGQGYKNTVAITLGTGVGGGVIIDGKIMSGSFHGGAELGHMMLEMGGEACTCGRNGCFEAYCSATALIRDAKIAAIRNPESMLNELVQKNLDKMNAKIPFDAAQSGDETAQKVIHRYISYLAAGVTDILNIFEPEVLVIGGGVCAQGDYLLKPLMKIVNQERYGGTPKTIVKIAELGNDAGLIGAAMLGKQ